MGIDFSLILFNLKKLGGACHMAYGILVPQLGIKLGPSVVKAQSLN